MRAGDQELGPYSDEALKRYAASGNIRPEQELRLSDGTTWYKAQQVRGLLNDGNGPQSESERNASFTDSEILRFSCPSCRSRWRFRAEHVGKTFECPACRARIVVPKNVRPPELGQSKAKTVLPGGIADADRKQPTSTNESGGPNLKALLDLGTSSVKKVVGWLQPPQTIDNAAWPPVWAKAARSENKTAPGQPDYRPQRDTIQFYGKGSVVDLGTGPLRNALVYATGRRFDHVQDASLIELSLPVRYDPQTLNRLPYWPTYHDSDPAQRGRYLKWLYDGRNDTTIDLGYVFIFFYGLEHRVLVDGADHLLVIEELMRLLKIHSSSRSFYGYATRLLWLTIFLAADQLGTNDELVQRACRQMARWTDETLRYCLAYYQHVGKALPSDVAFAVAEYDERSPKSVIAKRHPDQLTTLFAKRYRQQFPDGFLPKPSPTIKIDYRPASPTLLNGRDSVSILASKSVPDVLASQQALMMLVEIWNACVENLRDFDRASRQGAASTVTAAAYESLPPELRTDDHPELAAWQAAVTEATDASGWPVMSVGKLASIKGFEAQKKLTKRQSESLLSTADAIGFGIEPDIRLTGRAYASDQAVVVFRQDGDHPTVDEIKSFHSASILLQLGLTIAEADGSIDETELKHITGHLEQNFNLGQRLTKRLNALTHLLTLPGATFSGITPRTLKATLTLPQRQTVGEYIVGVAAADRVITPDEQKALTKVYRSLGVSSDVLHDLLARHAQTHPAAALSAGAAAEAAVALVPVELDLELIRKMRAETAQLQELLNDVLNPESAELSDAEDTWVEDTVESQIAPNPIVEDHASADGISASKFAMAGELAAQHIQTSPLLLRDAPKSYRGFLEVLITRPRWSRAELTSLARERGVMLNAAVEVLNEWSVDAIEELLIEESGEDVLIHRECMENC